MNAIQNDTRREYDGKDNEQLKKRLDDAVGAKEKAEKELNDIKKGLSHDERDILELLNRVEEYEERYNNAHSGKGVRELEVRYDKMLREKNEEIWGFKIEMDMLVDELRMLS